MTQTPVALARPAGLAAVFRAMRDDLALRARRRAAYRRTLADLSAMSDRDLADIGIARFMIEDIAAEAAARV